MIESQKGFTLMKKHWIALLTGCVLVCSMLAGCGSKPQTSAPAAAGSAKGCTDEAILSQLKNDGTPAFVLDGTYYTLPLEMCIRDRRLGAMGCACLELVVAL